MPNEIPKMSAHKIKTPDNAESNKIENQKYTFKMRASIQDYGNEFMALKIFNNFSGGIDGVHKLMEEHKIKTFEEYRGEKEAAERPDPNTKLTSEEYKNPTVQSKVKELNEFAVRLNLEGTTISKEEFDKIMRRMHEIIYDEDYK